MKKKEAKGERLTGKNSSEPEDSSPHLSEDFREKKKISSGFSAARSSFRNHYQERGGETSAGGQQRTKERKE